jgi:pimeloyl-ACP methyl ester carboxylesterase
MTSTTPLDLDGHRGSMTPVPRVEYTITTDDGAELAVTIAGGEPVGPVVVLAHGWGARRDIWQMVVERLVRVGITTVTFDQRGHGASTLGRTRLTIDRLGRDLGSVITGLGVGDPVLVGHSGGGYAIISYLTHDGAVSPHGVMLAATASHGQRIPLPERRIMGTRTLSAALRRPGLGARILRHTVGPDCDAALVEHVRDMFASTDRRVRRATFSSTKTMDLRSRLDVITAPTVVLAGEHDAVIEPSFGRQLADSLPAATFELVAGAGHMLPLEAPGVIVGRIKTLHGASG